MRSLFVLATVGQSIEPEQEHQFIIQYYNWPRRRCTNDLPKKEGAQLHLSVSILSTYIEGVFNSNGRINKHPFISTITGGPDVEYDSYGKKSLIRK